ncbi:MAG TPA: 50S ribosomal protein L6 [Candidatus Poseidoniales archaeon]|nr:MAG TPA: 50S ribosomal protein L6 [Candidatus Poseidoniales archaeon]
MVQIDRIEHVVDLPEGVNASLDEEGNLSISGEKGSLSRQFVDPRCQLFQEENAITVRIDMPRRKEKAMAGTWKAHIANMVKGVTSGFEYHLKAVYSHFPMTLAVKGNEFVVNNYFGERVPRRADILDGVKVEVKNKVEVVVSGIDKEKVGQTSANIERCTTVKNRDRRVFQDGIYLLEKM